VDTWLADLAAVAAEADNCDRLPIYLWALRSGALLAGQVLSAGTISAKGLVLWSPCTNGSKYIDQFLRLRLLATMIAKSDRRESIADLRSRLQSGQSVEVAGYEINSEMLLSIDRLDLVKSIGGTPLPIMWTELVGREGDIAPAIASDVTKELADSGCDIQLNLTVGPKFWTTSEITTAPDLVELTTGYFAGL
jgi:exosortase A-associated hydrolase 2